MSDKNALYQSVRKHEIIIKRALMELADRVCALGGYDENEISVFFGDCIIEDSAALSDRALKEFEHGIIDQTEYFMRVYKLTEKQAADKVSQIMSRRKV